jgi:DNA (cytosine-5)-methyltransferase 1
MSFDRPKWSAVELFTGAGGLAQSLDLTGTVDHRLAVELDRRACATLRLNGAYDCDADVSGGTWPLFEGDIRSVDFERMAGSVDLVAGGVPCQPWSLGGAHRGFDDERNLWPELFRTVRETRPRVVIAENVKGLLRQSFRPYYDYILDSLAAPFELPIPGEDWQDHQRRLQKTLARSGPDDERYIVTHQLVNAADYGVPQQRWRVFVVAFRADLGLDDWRFPSATHSEAALLRSQADGSYWERHGLSHKSDRDALPLDDGLEPWMTLRDAICDLPEPLGHKVEHPDWLHHYGWAGARSYPGHTPNQLDRPAKTIKAGVHGVPGGETVLQLDDGSLRYMTVREASRVMTFPDTWRLAGPRGEQMRQLGNAVPVKLGHAIVSSVFEALKHANAAHSNWSIDPICDAQWAGAPGRSRADFRREQDEAAGGIERRRVRTTSGLRIASIELKPNRKGRRIYAYLRYTEGGQTHTTYLGEVTEATREKNLASAWALARASNAALLQG